LHKAFIVFTAKSKITVGKKLWGPWAQRPWSRCATCASVNQALAKLQYPCKRRHSRWKL